jgi:predicted nuclease of predicted toxin-antitoxin system
MGSAADFAIWRKASQDGSVIITKDEDFALRRVRSSERAPGGNVVAYWEYAQS